MRPKGRRPRLKEKTVLTNRRLQVFFIVMLAMGLFFTLFQLFFYDDVHRDERVEIPMGESRTWETGLGVASGIGYRVEVINGGPVDVYVSYNEKISYHSFLDGHVGVKEVEGSLPDQHMYLFLHVDNTADLGEEPTGLVEVRVEYWATNAFTFIRMAFCLSIGVVLPLVFLLLPVVRRRRHPLRRTIYSRTGRPLDAWDVDRWLRSPHKVFSVFMVFIFGVGLVLALVIIQFPTTDHGYLLLGEGMADNRTLSLMNEGVVYEVEVTLGGPLDVYLTDGIADGAVKAKEGHSHEGVTKARGVSRSNGEDVRLMVDNTDDRGVPTVGRAEARVLMTRTFSVTALNLMAAGAAVTFVSFQFMMARIREFRAMLVHVEVPTGPGTYARRYDGLYRPSGGNCMECGTPLVQGPSEMQHFCPACNWAPTEAWDGKK